MAALPLHVSASTAEIDDTGRVLMVDHHTLRKWLLLGRHLEPCDHSLYSAAFA